MKLKMILALVTFCTVHPCVALAVDYSKVLSVRVATESSMVVPGESTRVGVFITLEEGWHIYWKNPGDAGLPTKIVPGEVDGLSYGDLIWPLPERFKQPGGIRGNGYEKNAAFLLPVAVSPQASKQSYRIPLKLSWLLCSKSVCVPGAKAASVDLVVGDSNVSNAQEQKAFELAEARSIQRYSDKTPTVRSLSVSSGGKQAFKRVVVHWAQVPTNLEVFLDSKEKGLEVLSVEKGSESSMTEFLFAEPESKKFAGELLIAGDFKEGRQGISVSLELLS